LIAGQGLAHGRHPDDPRRGGAQGVEHLTRGPAFDAEIDVRRFAAAAKG
jgi:hypothetical protein